MSATQNESCLRCAEKKSWMQWRFGSQANFVNRSKSCRKILCVNKICSQVVTGAIIKQGSAVLIVLPPPPTSFNWCHIFKACFLSHWEEASKRNMNKRNIICQTRNRSCNKSDWLSSSHVSISAIFVMKITLWLESHSGPCARARLCRAHPADWLLISPHTCHPSSHQLWRILNMFSTSPSAIQASVWLSFVTLTWPRRWFDHRAPV